MSTPTSLPSHGQATGNQPPGHYFLHPDIVSRVVCHTAQIRIHSIIESGKQPPVLLPSTGGAPIDPAIFGYIRVSHAEGESGLATQRRILNGHGLRDDRIFTDVASGKNMRRPSWGTLREMLNPGDTVVVPRIDRLARNLTEGLKTIEELHGQGINIRSLAEGLDTGDDSPTSRLMLHMLLSLAEWERDTIRAGSRPEWTAPWPRAGPGAGHRRCRPRRWRPSGPSWRTAGRSAPRPGPSG